MMSHKPLILLSIFTLTLVSACGEKNVKKTTNPEKSIVTTTKTPDNAVPKSAEPIVVAAPKPDRGQVLYKRCATCHTLEQGGRNKVGPNLSGIFGAKAGAKDGFNYSSTMKASNLIWTDENLMGYIQNPAKFMPGNRMSFVGLRKSEDLEALIEYMKKEMATE